MALRRFALIILTGFFPYSNAAVAADIESVDVSERKTIADVSVEVADLSKSVTVGSEPLRIRRAENPAGSLVLIRNETGVPLIASFAAEDEQEVAGERVPTGGTIVRRCETSGAHYALAIASERGEKVLNAQLTCGDSIVVQPAGLSRAHPLGVVNDAWALPSGESSSVPQDWDGGN